MPHELVVVRERLVQAVEIIDGGFHLARAEEQQHTHFLSGIDTMIPTAASGSRSFDEAMEPVPMRRAQVDQLIEQEIALSIYKLCREGVACTAVAGVK